MKTNGQTAEESIRKEAYLLSEKAGHPAGMDGVFWMQAERLVHERITAAAATNSKAAPKKPASKAAASSETVPGKPATKRSAAVMDATQRKSAKAQENALNVEPVKPSRKSRR